MAITLYDTKYDDQDLPVVSWVEDRNLFAPDGISPARVSCFIRPDPETRVLQFVSVGPVRHGETEEARPWELLKAFERSSADHLYRSAQERAAWEWLGSKDKTGIARMAATDGAQVMLADFADARPTDPMHLNCAVASPVEAARLHDRLTREFIANRPHLMENKCYGGYVWPQEKPFQAYEPPAPMVCRPGWIGSSTCRLPRCLERWASRSTGWWCGRLRWRPKDSTVSFRQQAESRPSNAYDRTSPAKGRSVVPSAYLSY